MAWTERFSIESLPEQLRNLDRRDDEATRFAQQDPFSQDGFFELRVGTAHAGRKGIEDVLANHVPERGLRIAEFGSGAHGVLYRLLLPDRYKNRFYQYDISPEYVRLNRRASRGLFSTPPINIGNAYQMPLGKNSCDAVLGLSAWDSIGYPEDTYIELHRVLSPGGAFIHFQDIVPSDYPLWRAQLLARRRRGLPKEFFCKYMEDRSWGALYWTPKVLIGLEAIERDGKMVTASDYLTIHLADLARDAGFEVPLQGKIETRLQVPRREYQRSLMRHHLSLPEEFNAFRMTPEGGSYPYHSNDAKGGQVMLTSIMQVLVARKV